MHPSWPRQYARVAAALLLLALLPIAKLSLNVLTQSGLFADTSGASQKGLGTIFNISDSLSYASWAYQAKLGRLSFADLFTTEGHSAIFVNAYFLAMGSISRVVGLEPLRVMEFSSLVFGPLVAVTVWLISRELKFNRIGQYASVIFVLYGSGPSCVLRLVEKFGGQHWNIPSWVRPGADSHFTDLFPATAFVLYPYHAAAFAFLSLNVLVAIKLLNTQDDAGSLKLALLLGGLSFFLGFVRPYEAVATFLIFNVLICVRAMELRETLTKNTLLIFLVFNLCALPPIGYSAYMTTLPVWDNFSRKSLGIEDDTLDFILGFSILWSFAGAGLFFAAADRNGKLIPLGVWAVLTAGLLCLSPSYGTKLAAGCLLPTGLMAAYGAGRLVESAKRTATRRTLGLAILSVIAVMVLTPTWIFSSIVLFGVAKVDADLLAAGQRIRDLEGMRIPTVLTSSQAGEIIPGAFGERVYAGHWSLTPDFKGKRDTLKRAGLEVSDDSGKAYDRLLFESLVRDTRPNYILIHKNAPAAEMVSACAQARFAYSGYNWLVVDASGWSC